MLEKFLEYQEIDKEITNIKKLINNNEDKKNFAKMNDFMDKAKISLDVIDQQAKVLEDNLNKYKKIQEKGISFVNTKFADVDVASKSEDELFKIDDKIKSTLNQLEDVEKFIKNTSNDIDKCIKEYETLMKKVKQAKISREESRAKYQEFVNEKKPQHDELNAKLLEIEKQLDSKLVQQYKLIKKDKGLPVFVKLIGKNCGACRMEFSLSNLNTLKNNGYLECEHCHKINYIEN